MESGNSRRHYPPTVFGAHLRIIPTHHKAAKKKGNGDTSTDVPMSLENAIVPQQNRNSNNADISVEHVAEGEFEVNLHDLGIPHKTWKPCEGLKPASSKPKTGM